MLMVRRLPSLSHLLLGSIVLTVPMLGWLQTEDGLVHIEWYERKDNTDTAEAPEYDEIVFPDEANFEKVRHSCGHKETDRSTGSRMTH